MTPIFVFFPRHDCRLACLVVPFPNELCEYTISFVIDFFLIEQSFVAEGLMFVP